MYFYSEIKYCSSTICSFTNDKSLIDWHFVPFHKNMLKGICSQLFNICFFPWTRRYPKADTDLIFCELYNQSLVCGKLNREGIQEEKRCSKQYSLKMYKDYKSFLIFHYYICSLVNQAAPHAL